jgi:hypothetical protein
MFFRKIVLEDGHAVLAHLPAPLNLTTNPVLDIA